MFCFRGRTSRIEWPGPCTTGYQRWGQMVRLIRDRSLECGSMTNSTSGEAQIHDGVEISLAALVFASISPKKGIRRSSCTAAYSRCVPIAGWRSAWPTRQTPNTATGRNRTTTKARKSLFSAQASFLRGKCLTRIARVGIFDDAHARFMSSSATDLGSAQAQHVTVTNDSLTVDLVDGRTVSVPIAWYPRLAHASTPERDNWRLIGRGEGIHWPISTRTSALRAFLLAVRLENRRPLFSAGWGPGNRLANTRFQLRAG